MTRARKRRPQVDCRSGSEKHTGGLDGIVRHYERYYRPRARESREFFADLSSLDEAIEHAGWAKKPNGKRHPHQTRLSRAALGEATARLRANRNLLRQCTHFDRLYEVVSDTIGPIKGVGELMVYDTAIRLGAHLGLEPTRVYLHSGTRVGARALGFTARDTLDPVELPEPLQSLAPYELEDCLCIYKDAFKQN